MTTVERSRLVDAAPTEVWKVLSEFETMSSWAPNVEHSCFLTEGASDVGTTRRVQVGRSALIETVVEWEEPHTLSVVLPQGAPSCPGSVAPSKMTTTPN